tara:strand:- start:252 stop:641 length:390 start_codon:yes stop_codon:yes gene_type:complete
MQKLFSTILLISFLLSGNAYAKDLSIVCTIIAAGNKQYAEGDYDFNLVYKNNMLNQTNIIHQDFKSNVNIIKNFLDNDVGVYYVKRKSNSSDTLEIKLNRNTGFLYSTISYSGKKFRTDKFKCKKSNKL